MKYFHNLLWRVMRVLRPNQWGLLKNEWIKNGMGFILSVSGLNNHKALLAGVFSESCISQRNFTFLISINTVCKSASSLKQNSLFASSLSSVISFEHILLPKGYLPDEKKKKKVINCVDVIQDLILCSKAASTHHSVTFIRWQILHQFWVSSP